ncbi:hypothetical protein DW355_07545 [Hylemonella gracilis]|uniref:Restriction endonuclease type IV Mrr domain-containing protein n=1 Tax=Hylemonella gracilis TaxID=80880 RepID=A0A4V1A233_9BURK|nr:restriction endonuclease [Hylemonella gracilis]QBK04649.1 hypothetical protein DW355_07545 [Hylemonella gracilis]
MNTSLRGRRFEDEVFDLLRDELEADRLGLLARHCSTFQRKGYYSRDRGTDIVVDISIEVRLPNAKDWSMLWVCECKDYRTAIPVDDVEEFKAKLDQIAGKNVKGVLAISGAIQAGGLAYAKANGIAVLRILPRNQVRWVSYRARPEFEPLTPNYTQAVTSDGYVSENQEFFAKFNGRNYDTWRALLSAPLSISIPE